MASENKPLVLSGEGTPMGVGRPLRWDRAVEAAALIGTNMTYAEVAAAVGVTERTLYNWRCSPWWTQARNEALGERVRGIELKAIGNIVAAIEGGDVKVAQWLLARTAPEVFGEPRARSVREKESVGQGGGRALPSEEEYEEMSVEELEAAAGYDFGGDDE